MRCGRSRRETGEPLAAPPPGCDHPATTARSFAATDVPDHRPAPASVIRQPSRMLTGICARGCASLPVTIRWGYRRAHAVLGRGGLCGQPEEDPTALVGRGPARARQTAPAPAPGRVCPARRAHGSSVCAVDTPYCAGTGSALRRRRRCSPLHPHQHLEAGQPEQQSAMAARRGGELPIRQLPTDLINYRKMVRVAVRIHITVIFRASVAVLARRLFPAPRESAAPVGGQTRQ